MLDLNKPGEGEGDNLINHDDDAQIDADLEALEEEIMAMTEEELANDPEKQEKLKDYNLNKAKETIQQKRHWREKAKKEEPAPPKKPEPATPPKKEEAGKDDSVQEVRRVQEHIDFRLDHPELPKNVIDEVSEFARANNLTLEKALNRPLIQKYIEDKKIKRDTLAASPTSKNRSTPAAGEKDWSKASLAEIKQHRSEIISRGVSRR